VVSADSEAQGQRLDNYLLRHMKGVPKSHIYRILRTGEVRVNKGRVTASYRIQAGDLIRLPPIRLALNDDLPQSAPKGLLALLEERILFEDARLLVLNKPSGLAVHGGSGLSLGVIEALRQLRPTAKHLELVHRLDRETSGCLLLAKKMQTLRDLHDALRLGRVEKIYQALLLGTWRGDQLRVDAPLLKNQTQGGERMVRVDPRGKAALTVFRPVRRWADYSLVNALLETGRTHQIRVHAAHLGRPIAGDEKYGDQAANARLKALGLKRLFLHATSLKFRLPGDAQTLHFQAPLDRPLQDLLNALGTPL
jgi:23S rRNA pseudouridine955/2504/2580 synthase